VKPHSTSYPTALSVKASLLPAPISFLWRFLVLTIVMRPRTSASTLAFVIRYINDGTNSVAGNIIRRGFGTFGTSAVPMEIEGGAAGNDTI